MFLREIEVQGQKESSVLWSQLLRSWIEQIGYKWIVD